MRPGSIIDSINPVIRGHRGALKATPPISSARLWIGLAPAMVLPCLASLVYFVWLPGGAIAQAIYGATKVFTLAWPLACFWWWRRRGAERPRFLAKEDRSRHLKSLPLGAATGIGIGAFILMFAASPLGAGLLAEAGPKIGAKVDALGIRDAYWLFAAFLAVAHSGIEEYFWRWFVFGNLRRLLPAAGSLALAAAAFASHHVVVLAQFFPLAWAFALGAGVGIGGALWSWMYARQNSLAGAWLSHMLIDVAILWIGWLAIR